MAVHAAVLTEDDQRILREMYDAFRDEQGNTTQRPRVDLDEHEAPEVYIARTIEQGIPALEEEPGAGIKDRPGFAYCEIYRIQEVTNSRHELRPVPTLKRRVYNLTKQLIPAGEWLPVARDKFGKWLALRGGTGGTDEIWVEINGADCAAQSFSFVEIEHVGGNSWQQKQGGVTTSFCYHVDGFHYQGGPLIAVPTRCRARPGAVVSGNQHWIIDCPVGWKGDNRWVDSVRCENNQLIVDYKWLQVRNGQVIREPCPTVQPGVCNACQTLPFSPFSTLGRLAMLAAGLASAWGVWQ